MPTSGHRRSPLDAPPLVMVGPPLVAPDVIPPPRGV